jgi:predicted DNA-binding protein (MmcQ/YjbR family)
MVRHAVRGPISVSPMTADELRAHCLSMPAAAETFPFAPEVSVFKVDDKIFAIAALAKPELDVSVKCDPDLAEALRKTYDAVTPGYHLNKRHWITITLNADLPDDTVRDLIEDSYDLVKRRRAARRSPSGGA